MLRFWAEYLKPEELVSEKAVDILTRYKAQILIALRFEEYKKWTKAFKTAYDKGVDIGIWPLLPDEKGYWVNERNVDDFRELLSVLLKWAEENGFAFSWVAADMEMPYYQGQRLSKASILHMPSVFFGILKENINRTRFVEATRKLNSLVEWLHSKDIRVIAPAVHILLDVPEPNIVEDFLEAPTLGVDWDLVSFMNYVSMDAGFIPFVSEKAARYALYLRAIKAKKILGKKAGFSVGVTYIGKLGNEPFYKYPEQLAADISACRAAGIQDITIYNFEGIVRRKNRHEWMEK
ncbi:MAG: hypothetical protein QXL15_03430, partial [Candidatus Korarchaeota archaeon]